jgi:hypothetical protein
MINSGAQKLALPFDFYMLHNGFYFEVDPDVPDSSKIVAARKQQFHDHGRYEPRRSRERTAVRRGSATKRGRCCA